LLGALVLERSLDFAVETEKWRGAPPLFLLSRGGPRRHFAGGWLRVFDGCAATPDRFVPLFWLNDPEW